MELSLLWIFTVLSALPSSYSTLNGSENRNVNNDTKITDVVLNLKRRSTIQIKNGNLLNDQRATNELIKPIPTSLKVRSDSILYADVGQEVVINIEVTNNQNKHISYIFEGILEDKSNLVQITPPSSDAPPSSKILVKVQIFPRAINSGKAKGLLTFKAKWVSLFEEEVSQEIYYFIGTQKTDSSSPTISYTFSGDCSDHLSPTLCHNKIWKADISIQDGDSGLLHVKSVPVGLILNKKFIVGTTEEVTGYYRANCCQSKVEIIASDVSGNENTINIDIEKKWLSKGEIISIILGAIILVLLIIALIVCIVFYCRRNRRTLSIYPETIRS